MAQLSPQQVAAGIRRLRWLVWSVMRCHREYQADTSALITKLRRLSKRRRFTGGTEQDSRIRAAATAVRAFVLLERIAQRLNSSELRLSLGQAQLTRFRGRIVRVISFALRSSMRFPMNAVSIEREEIGFFLQDSGKEPVDLLPELQDFRRRWGLRFPLPPELSLPKQMDIDLIEQPASRSVQIVSENPQKIELHIFPIIPKQLLIEWAIGALQASPYLRRTRFGKVLSKKGRSIKPQIVTLKDGSLKVTIRFPCDLEVVRSTLRPRLKGAGYRLREIEEAVAIGALRDCSSQPEKPSFKNIASRVFGNDQEESRGKAFDRYRLFTRLQRQLLQSAIEP